MLVRKLDVCLLRAGDVPASRDDFEVVGAFNPGAIKAGGGDEVVLLVRVAERPRERREGFVPLPRWEIVGTTPVVDWVADDELEWIDPRVVRLRESGMLRLTFTSHIRVVRLADGQAVTSVDGPVFAPETRYETYGIEDPRITRIGDTCYFTYVAVSAHGAATALASTQDFVSFERHGVIFHPENKDIVLFDEQIGGEYVAIHRPNPQQHFSPPEMWVARSPDLLHWGRHERLIGGSGTWDTGRTGAGPPPLRVDDGWLLIYHGNERETRQGVVGAYAAGALLLDANDPTRVIARTAEPILTATAPHEVDGFVPNVVFPTGLVRRGDELWLYNGAGDAAVGLTVIDYSDLRAALQPV